jgi:hypothetical protein
MPSPGGYKPTGRPVGRPPKPPPEPGEKGFKRKMPRAPGWMGPQPPDICGRDFPEGWPAGATGLSCIHGTWTRRING